MNHPVKINRLALALERASNFLIEQQVSGAQKLYELAVETLQKKIEPILLDFLQRAKAIKNSTRLSDKGKAEELDELKEATISKVAQYDEREKLTQGISNLEATIINIAAQEVDRYRPKDARLDYYQQRDILSYLNQLREKKFRQYEQWLEEQRTNGVAVPDEMARFNEPAEALYIHSCQHYGPETAQLFRAIVSAPWPVEPLSPEITEKGKQLMRQTVAPEQHELLEQANARLEMESIVIGAVAEIIKNPTSISVQPEPYHLQSDEDRRAAATRSQYRGDTMLPRPGIKIQIIERHEAANGVRKSKYSLSADHIQALQTFLDDLNIKPHRVIKTEIKVDPSPAEPTPVILDLNPLEWDG